MIPFARAAAWAAGLGGWTRRGFLFLLGLAYTAALPPLYLLPAMPVAVTGLLWALDGARGWRGRFATIWWFGFGHYISGLYWIGEAFFVDADRYAWLVGFPVVVLPAVISALPATAFATVPWDRVRPLGRPILFALLWVGVEWLRAYGLLGFPWNLAGSAWGVSDAMFQSLAWAGIFGVSLLTLLGAGLPATLAQPGRAGVVMVSAGLLTVLTVFVAGSIRLADAGSDTVSGVRLRLVQANISQQMKWANGERLQNLEKHIALSTAPAAVKPTHVVWPETAVPFLLDADPNLLTLLAEKLGPETVLLAGALRRTPAAEPLRIWNSLHAITSGRVAATYDKQHLVPFGEFLPFRPILSAIGLDRVALSAIDFSTGAGPALLPVPHAPPARALICYEAIFPAETREYVADAGWLLNVTNDAWFGVSAGPYQHLEAARARAMELGLPLVRVAGTGISAVIDPYGRIVASIPLHNGGYVDADLPQALVSKTPYHKWGDGLFLGLAFVLGAIFARISSVKKNNNTP